jgi:hypothetical protein
VYDCVHKDWRDVVTLSANGTYARGNGDPGTWTFDNRVLALKWKNWPTELLSFAAPGVFKNAQGFSCQQKQPADARQVIGTYDVVHKHWRDAIVLTASGTVIRGGNEVGRWGFDGKQLVMFWNEWGPEPAELVSPGRFSSSAYLFTLTRRADLKVAANTVAKAARNVGRLIATDKTSYRSGDRITISYRGMRGTSTDWITIVRAGEATTEWGDWEYTNGTPSGARVFDKSLEPGEYEARAYFENSETLQDRVSFSVTE